MTSKPFSISRTKYVRATCNKGLSGVTTPRAVTAGGSGCGIGRGTVSCATSNGTPGVSRTSNSKGAVRSSRRRDAFTMPAAGVAMSQRATAVRT